LIVAGIKYTGHPVPMRLNRLTNPRLWSVLLACSWLTLFVLTHIPRVPSLGPVTEHDKTAHLVAFAVLAFILATTWQLNAGELSLAQLGWAWVLLMLYAALDEWTQQFVGRQASVADWLADLIGAAAGLSLFFWFRRWIRHRPLEE
jgi:VanZ family protein